MRDVWPNLHDQTVITASGLWFNVLVSCMNSVFEISSDDVTTNAINNLHLRHAPPLFQLSTLNLPRRLMTQAILMWRVEVSRTYNKIRYACGISLSHNPRTLSKHNERIKRHQIRGMGSFRQDLYSGELQVVRVRAQDFLRG